MAVTADWFSRASQHLALGELAYAADDIKVMLLTDAYVWDQDAHESYADVIANEVATGNGYAAGGLSLGTKSTEFDAALNRTRLKAANAVWTPGSGESLSAANAIIYKDSGTDNTSWLMGFIDFGAVITAVGAPLTINWDPTDGLLYLNTV